METGLSSIVCDIPYLKDMNLTEAVEYVLAQTNAGEYDIDIPLNLPNAAVKFVLFIPVFDSVLATLNRLAESYGAKVEVIEDEKLIRLFRKNHSNFPRTYA